MHVLFIHQNFPAQFRYIAPRLIADYGYRCTFVTERAEGELPGVEKILYKPRGGATIANHPLTRNFENTVAHAHGVFEALKLRRDLAPDLIVAHTGFGSSLFTTYLFDAPLINFLEFFYHPVGQDMGFRPEMPVEEMNLLRSKTSNAMILLDAVNCDRGWTPTHYQRDFFPPELRSKIEVIFDGIDTAVYYRKPDAPARVRAELKIPDDHRIVTYVARGFEMMRGFDIFMKAAQRIYQQFEKVTFIVVGTDRIHYGSDLKFIKEKTFRHHVLAEGNYDLSRFRFTGYVPHDRLADYLSSADVHIYLTEPFIASWSMVNAMACGAVLVASDQTCVREYVQPGINGILENFFDFESIAARTVEVLNNPGAFTSLRDAAMATVTEKYSLDVAMPRIKSMFETVAAIKRQPSQLLEKLVRPGTLAPEKSEAEAEAVAQELSGIKPPPADQLDPESDLAKATAEIKRISAAEQQPINWPRIVQSYHGPPGPLETIGPPNHPIDLARLLQRLGQWNAHTILELGQPDIGLTFLWTRVVMPQARIIIVPLRGLTLPDAKRELLPSIPRPKQQLVLVPPSDDLEAQDKLIDKALQGRSLDFVFMHGQRPYKDLAADYRRLKKKVRPDGLISWDGINPITKTAQTEGGDRLWNEVKPLFPHRAEYLNGVINETGGIAMIKI